MEVEIKARINSESEFIDKIEHMGAVFLREEIEVDVYYNHPCRNFAETDEALRIRNDNSLTYKGKKVGMDTKSREEFIVHFDNSEAMDKILKVLGFREVATVRKRRKYYKMGELNICVDSVDGLGEFTEVECIGDYEDCRKRVLDATKKLGLKNMERKSYLELVLENQ